jgi:hypothetical protein
MIYEKNKYQYKEKNGVVEKETNSNTIVRFDVLSETDSNYILSYQISSILIDSTFHDLEGINSYLESTESIFPKLVYKIETTAYGELISVINWEEIKEKIKTFFDENMTLFGETMNEEESKNLKNIMGKMMDSEEKVQTMIQKEIGFLFSMYGYEYATKDTINYDQLLPNPFGSTPFPKYGELYFEPLDTNNHTIKMVDKSIIDKDAGKKAIIEMLKNLMPEDKQKMEEMEQEFAKAEFNISDKIELDFNIFNGVIEFGQFERIMNINDLKDQNNRIDRFTFKLVK